MTKPIAWRWRSRGWDFWIICGYKPDLDCNYYEVQALVADRG